MPAITSTAIIGNPLVNQYELKNVPWIWDKLRELRKAKKSLKKAQTRPKSV